MGRRRRPRRRAGGDRGRALHIRHTGHGSRRFEGLQPRQRRDRRSTGDPDSDPHAPLPGPDDPGAGELPQPRLPPRAAGADAAGAGDVLDLARADVRRRGAARPGLLPRAGDRHLPRDGRGRDHLRGGVPLPAPPARRHAVRRPERDGPRPARGGPARPGSGSPCSTPATSRRASGGRSRACSAASATATSTAGASGVGGLEDARRRTDRRRLPLRPRRAARPDAAPAPPRRCTSTSPSRWRRTSSAWRRTG